MVWTTNRPSNTELTVDGGGLVVAITLARFPKGEVRLVEVVTGSEINIEIKNVFERTIYICAVYWTPPGAQQGSRKGSKYVEEEAERTAKAIGRWTVEADRDKHRKGTIFCGYLNAWVGNEEVELGYIGDDGHGSKTITRSLADKSKC